LFKEQTEMEWTGSVTCISWNGTITHVDVHI